ncbi:hypothetical protein Tco_1428702 [Tanacetum coccineum]
MPQESLRSVVYRSFVTCEDPRGVVEGKTIRISKTDTTKMSSKRAENESHIKISKEKEKMSLVEVKNGAQKLNEAIDSWSKGASFRSQPKDIAKDLLKGALDLQESLMMLGKLQESTYITGLKKKEKPSEELSSRIGSDRFESFRVYDTGYEKERKLANGSSRDCYAELRDVIREGLTKQNLLPNKSYQQNAYASRDSDELAGKRKMQLSPDIASTSSSRSSSMMYSTHEFTSSESFSSRATEEKSKGSNLIAKLMGLEEFPSKPPPPSPQKQMEVSSKLRSVFDVDLPNAKRPQSFMQKINREHMSLDEVIDMMQYKGLLRNNKREMKPTSNKFIDDTPPIVLMRPQRLGHDNQSYKVYENPMRRIHQEKVKVEDKGVKNRGNPKLPSDKQKASVPVVTRPQRKQDTEKKIDKVQKTASPVKRKPVDNTKSTNSVSKIASPKQVKPQRNAIQNPVPKRTSSSVLSASKSGNQKKNVKVQKPVANPLPTTVNEDLPNDLASQEESQDFKVTMKEVDNVIQQFEDRDSDAVSSMDQSETRDNHEERSVSDLSEQKAIILKTISNFQDSEQVNDVLVQDCITEFLEHENQSQNPFLRIFFPIRVCVSEDQMTRDIVKRIKNLRSFSKLSNDSSNAADIVPVLLEKDLYLTTHGGVWSTTGWKDGCTINEVEEAVLDLEKIILSRLIDEMLMELVTKGRFVQKTV